VGGLQRKISEVKGGQVKRHLKEGSMMNENSCDLQTQCREEGSTGPGRNKKREKPVWMVTYQKTSEEDRLFQKKLGTGGREKKANKGVGNNGR